MSDQEEFRDVVFPRMLKKWQEGTDPLEMQMHALVGFCLLSVQQGERFFALALKGVLKDRTLTPSKLMQQTERQRRRTLGDFVREFRGQVKIERNFRNKLYRFLNMRNTLVHNVSEVDGWSFNTKEGRAAAGLFLLELMFLANSMSAVFLTVIAISAREDLDEEILENDSELMAMLKIIEKHFGPIARKILTGRYRRLALVHSRSE